VRFVRAHRSSFFRLQVVEQTAPGNEFDGLAVCESHRLMHVPLHKEKLRQPLEDSPRETDFLQKLAGAYRGIYASVLSIVGNRADAEDVVQEVCAILWQKFDEFEPDKNFNKWSYGVAFLEAKAFVRHRRRRTGFGMSEDALMKIAFAQSAGSELFELRRELLHDCLNRLSLKDRRFIMDCYDSETTLVEHARSRSIPIASLYTRLKRLRERLMGCISRHMQREDDAF